MRWRFRPRGSLLLNDWGLLDDRRLNNWGLGERLLNRRLSHGRSLHGLLDGRLNRLLCWRLRDRTLNNGRLNNSRLNDSRLAWRLLSDGNKRRRRLRNRRWLLNNGRLNGRLSNWKLNNRRGLLSNGRLSNRRGLLNRRLNNGRLNNRRGLRNNRLLNNRRLLHTLLLRRVVPVHVHHARRRITQRRARHTTLLRAHRGIRRRQRVAQRTRLRIWHGPRSIRVHIEIGHGLAVKRRVLGHVVDPAPRIHAHAAIVVARSKPIPLAVLPIPVVHAHAVVELLARSASPIMLELPREQHVLPSLVLRPGAVTVVLQIAHCLVLANVDHFAVLVKLGHFRAGEGDRYQVQISLRKGANLRYGPILVKPRSHSVQLPRHGIDVTHAFQSIRLVTEERDEAIILHGSHLRVERDAILVHAIRNEGTVHVLLLSKTVAFPVLVVTLVGHRSVLLLVSVSVNRVVFELSRKGDDTVRVHVRASLDGVVHIRAFKLAHAVFIKEDRFSVLHSIFEYALHHLVVVRVLEVDDRVSLKNRTLCVYPDIVHAIPLQIASEIVHRGHTFVIS